MTIPAPMARSRPASLRPSAAEAYHAERAEGAADLEPDFLAVVLEIAFGLQAAESLEPAPRDLLIERLSVRARTILDPKFPHDLWNDPIGCESPTGALRTLAGQLSRGGRHRLAVHLVESLQSLYPPASLENGRILKALILCLHLVGDDSMSEARILRLLTLGRHLRSDELIFASWYSAAGAAMVRGNLPKLSRACERSLKYATRIGDARLLSIAYGAQATVHGERGEFSEALICHWKSISLDYHPVSYPMAVANTAETLYRCGFFQAARAARARALTEAQPLNNVFVCLGGYAVSCAALHDVRGVRWACEQLVSLGATAPRSRGFSQGLLGCADACGQVGLPTLAAELYAKGIAIADAKGFHDLRFRADPRVTPMPIRVDRAATTVVEAIEGLAPNGVSMDLVLTRD